MSLPPNRRPLISLQAFFAAVSRYVRAEPNSSDSTNISSCNGSMRGFISAVGALVRLQLWIVYSWEAIYGKIVNKLRELFRNATSPEKLFIVGMSVLIVGVIVPLLLLLLGFSPAGPVAGSAAAAWQSSIGSVSADSLFAFIQSFMMSGAAATFVGSVSGAGAGLVALSTKKVRDTMEDVSARISSLFGKKCDSKGGKDV